MMVAESRSIQSDDERRLLYALALMCDQYLGEDHEGNHVLDHMWMGAGQAAFEQLVAYGLLDVEGRGATWTDSGEELLNSNPNLDTK
jgi:hypothetical protein